MKEVNQAKRKEFTFIDNVNIGEESGQFLKYYRTRSLDLSPFGHQEKENVIEKLNVDVDLEPWS